MCTAHAQNSMHARAERSELAHLLTHLLIYALILVFFKCASYSFDPQDKVWYCHICEKVDQVKTYN